MNETVQVNNDEVEPTNTAVSMERQNLRLVRASLLLKQWILHLRQITGFIVLLDMNSSFRGCILVQQGVVTFASFVFICYH